MMSYCIIRSKLQRAKDEDKLEVDGRLPRAGSCHSSTPASASTSSPSTSTTTTTKLCKSQLAATREERNAPAPMSLSSQTELAISYENCSSMISSSQEQSSFRANKTAPTLRAPPTLSFTRNSCHSPGDTMSLAVGDNPRDADRSDSPTPATKTTTTCVKPRLSVSKRSGKHALTPWNWSFLLTLVVLCISLTDWRPEVRQASDVAVGRAAFGRGNDALESILDTLVRWVVPARGYLSRRGIQLAAAQYRPDWPSKEVRQEIFLLNLEDGYFGCQVNESQDFLQLFELSKLCDNQTQCYLGTDEMYEPLKCKDRNQCGSYVNSRGQQESVQCINGVCLDGLCYCNDGFGGKSCDVPDENECKFRPCDVFAHCTNTMGSYYCSCFPGYDGDGLHCQDINECEIPSLAALCSDNSECCNLPGHFVCKCKPGYQQSGQSQSSLSSAPSGNTTVLCTDIDECLDERACGRGASCENLPGSFRCSCPPGFTGDPAVECIDMDECRNDPCGVGAQCTNTPGGYRCSCPAGFEQNPALPASMFGNIQTTSTSQLGADGSAATAANSSLVACLDVNECLLSNGNQAPGGKGICGTGAQCINTPGAYFCQCPPNYTGNPKVSCVDIDECAAHVCGPNTQCKNLPGSYQCECRPGYVGNAYLPEGCQDEDECLKAGACGVNAQCFNTLGSHECSCLSGFTGDPRVKCADIDECASGNPCGPGAQCHNTPGGYKCACPDKYLARGSPEMGCERAAVDIGCSADYDCTRNALCVNATCQCKLGYQINGIECVDTDECALSQPLSAPPSPAQQVKPFTKLGLALSAASNASAQVNSNNQLCGPEAQCVNTDGAYKCECRAGYEKVDPTSGKSKCRDINECSEQPCGPNSKCFNTDGGYKCACTDGFIPIDQDPALGCKSPCSGVNCGQHATCKPHGEEAACVCKPGFTFDPNNIKLGCVDINECDTNYGPAGLCGLRAVCTNIPGSYRCHCPAGYSGDAERYCEDINECDRRYGVFGQCGESAICNNTAGSYTCSCAPGYAGDPRVKCHDVDECSPKFGPHGKCGVGAICTNSPGKFACRCPPGYAGDPTDRCVAERPACASALDCAKNQVCAAGRCQCPFATTTSQDDQQDQTECRHPCDKTECGLHATCQLDAENQALCVCDAGYMAPGDGRSGCVDVNECIQGVTLSGITPLSALAAGRGGSVPLGPVNTVTTLSPLGAGAAATNGSHPCGRNAICRNQPGSFDCVCPVGFKGDPYAACIQDVQNLQQQTATTMTTADANSNTAFDKYQQEPRTTACSEPCPRGQVCADGRCLKPDSCRDNHDCRTSMACEHVNQLLGFQCVNACELNRCGPEAKCTPINHKPICSCNASAGYAGDPYDLVVGCQLQQPPTSTSSSSSYNQQQQQQFANGQTTATATTASTSTTHHEMREQLIDLHRTTVSSEQQQGDLSTVSVGFQQQHSSGSSSSSGGNINSSFDQMQRNQILDSVKRPSNQPLIPYEEPLPSTPSMQQFLQQQQDSAQRTTTGEQRQQLMQQQFGQQPLVPQQTQASIVNQLSNQAQNLFGQNMNKNKKPSLPSTISGSNQQQLNRQDIINDATQKQQQTLEQLRQNQQIRDQVQQHEDQLLQQISGISQQHDEFLNKSALISYGAPPYAHKQLVCTSDQHCPGNLFCLSTDPTQLLQSSTKTNQKVCGCPPGYRREANYCFMQRTNCTSSSICKAREECISSAIIQQYYSLSGTSQQFVGANNNNHQQFAFNSDDYTGICICPRGYKLSASGLACIDRDECAEGTPCAVGAVCQNKIGSYECVCPPGTVGEPYTKTCEPRQECYSNSECPSDRECDLALHKCVSPCHMCGPRALCTAANHLAQCLCPPHYTGNAIDLVYGCQPPLPPTTAAPTTTTQPQTSTVMAVATTSGYQAPPTTTLRPSQLRESTTTSASAPTTQQPAIGVPVTTLLPSTTLAPLVESTTPELVEFRTIPPSELFVMCLADGIQVEVQLGGFDGIIYVKGHSQDPKCRKLVTSTSASEFIDFKVQFGHCDLIHRDGEAGFVLVIQNHPKLVTYRARAYHVKCVYNTGERTVTLGFNVSMITTSGTIANTGPPPTCLMSITALDGREVTSAEIGQDLLLRVDVQPDSIYGGFARSCEAKTMDDEGEYQYEVTDANGCATDPSIFSDWKYDQHRKSLVARFNAFKFPSSNNLRFQCNIRVCFGSCPAVNCNGIDAYGKRRRRREAPAIADRSNSSTDSLDPSDADELVVTDAFKEGALREEVMVQSNAILTFDRKEASLPQQRPQVEDIEFVCLPRLGIMLSIALTTLLALLALAIATSCWCFNKRKRQHGAGNGRGPLPHPINFPNPLMRSASSSTCSTLREPIYGP